MSNDASAQPPAALPQPGELWAARTMHSPLPLRQWLEGQFEPEWQAIESLIRASIRTDPLRTVPPAEIADLIQQLTRDSEVQRRQAAQQLGTIATDSADAIAALVALLQTTDDLETRWTAAESLWQLDPSNPAAGVRRVRLLDFEAAGLQVALAIALLRRNESQFSLMLRVYPMEPNSYVPDNLKLRLCDESGVH